MPRNRLVLVAAVVAMFPSFALAQFDPFFNHLKCYKISRNCPPSIAGCGTTTVGKTVTLRNQFGVEQAVVLMPLLLCVPTNKSCGDFPCGQDPTHDPVDHFKCYKVKASKPTVRPVVKLTDQFGTETVSVTTPLLLCTPVLKEVILPTTTTTTTITTTTTTTTTTLCGACVPCGSCGHGECHRSGGGGGCGAPGLNPVCVDTTTCTPQTCNGDFDCPAGNHCVFGPNPAVPSRCCTLCP